METINYSWNNQDDDQDLFEDDIDVKKSNDKPEEKLASRKDLQIVRRLFHMGNGVAVAVLYWASFSHQQMIHALGTLACLLYVFEQVRINYPEKAQKFLPMTKFIIRAEEQLKESAMVPYAFAVLLTIITFPKPIALIAILTLAIADPMSAIIGIKYGKRKVVPHKTLEGSAAFFIVTMLVSSFVLTFYIGGFTTTVFFVSLVLSFIASVFEMLPLKLDDNLTIPLFTAFALWILCESLSIHL